LITFVHVTSFEADVVVPEIWKDKESIDYIGGSTFQEIMDAEWRGTADALVENNRPNGTIHIPTVSPGSIGALLQFYEIATAYVGELLDINAYDQPGVESGKKRAKSILQG